MRPVAMGCVTVSVAVVEAVSMGTVASVRVAVALWVAWLSLESFAKVYLINGFLVTETVLRT